MDLTIASGKRQETLQSLGIGDAKATGDSGVFQLDYLLSTSTLREKVHESSTPG